MLKWTENMREEHIAKSREAALAVLGHLIPLNRIHDLPADGLEFRELVGRSVEQAWAIGEAFARQATTLWVRLEAEALAEEKEEP